VNRGCALVGICFFVTACAGSDSSSPSVAPTKSVAPSTTAAPASEPTSPAGNIEITFHGGSGALTKFVESGFTMTATSASWFFSSYGAPGPSAQFSTAAGITTEGEVMIASGGARFQFKSVDLYSSTTPIPYTFSGFAGSVKVFAVSGRQGNTFGNFATVANAQANASIDTLLIHLTNPAAPCCGNPMGLDNIVITR
jgi:hypothetical protein